MNYILLILSFLLFQSCGFNKNEDNLIYIPGRKFSYDIIYSDKYGEVKKVDSLELLVTYGFYPDRKQTAIEWSHYQKNGDDTKLITETTGVEDSRESYFIHPPRAGDLHILSFAEFPAIRTYVLKDPNAKSKGKGTVTMVKTFQGKTITNVETTGICR